MKRQERWIPGPEAEKVLSRAIGRKVSRNYVRTLHNNGTIRGRKWEDGRTNVYPESDLLRYGEEHNPNRAGREFRGGSRTHKRQLEESVA